MNTQCNMYNASCQYVYTGCLQFLSSLYHEQFINPMPKHFTLEEIIIKVGLCAYMGVRLAIMTLVRFSVQFCKKNCGFQFGTKFTVSFFRFVFLHLVLFNYMHSTFCQRHLSFPPLPYDTRNGVLPPCWIGPTNCQPKWLRTRSAEIRHEENTLSLNVWSYHVFENWSAETEFSVFGFWRQFG